MLQDNTIHGLQMRISLSEDMKAYKELYLLMFDSLFHFSYSFVKSKQVAEELVSDVFIKLWQIRGQRNSIDNLKLYLFGITKNFSLSYLAKASKNLSIQLDDIELDEAGSRYLQPNKYNNNLNGGFVRRMAYPNGEEAQNPDNYKAAIASMGGDRITQRVFWDKP